MAAPTKARPTPRSQLPGALRELKGSFNEQNLLTWSSALSFQIATSVVPFLLCGLGLIGFFKLDSVWGDIAKDIKPDVSAAAFTVINNTANKVLHQKQIFWVTLGFALAVWEVSGGIRAIMGGLGEVYDLEETRRWSQRAWRSIALALAVSVLALVAIAVVWLGPLAYGDVGQPAGALLFIVRWSLAAGLLGLACALTMRLSPDGYQPAGWVTMGTAIVVVAWVIASILFGLYLRYVAQYGSIFGALATIVVLFGYIYLSAIVFFAGAQVDAIIRRRVEGNPQGR